MPSGKTARIRGIQAHGDQQTTVESGVRAAVNLTGIEKDEIDRGDTLTIANALESSMRIDGKVRLLKDASMTLQQNNEIDFFAGSAEVPAKVTLLEVDELAPGGEGWVQFRLARPLALLKGDRFILRRLSPSETIGGGVVIDPAPVRHKRFRADVVASLETRASGSLEELILAQASPGPIAKSSLIKAVGDEHEATTLEAAVAALLETEQLARLSESADPARELLIAREAWNHLSEQLINTLASFHLSNPVRAGMPREELRRRSGLDQRIFDVVLVFGADEERWVDDGALVRLPSFAISLTPADRIIADQYLAEVRLGRFSPPAPNGAGVAPNILTALTETGELVRVGDGVFYDPDVLAEIEKSVIDHLDQHGSISLAEFRDRFDTSRKYAQAVLEYFDRVRVTRRVGDVRRRYPRGGVSNLEES